MLAVFTDPKTIQVIGLIALVFDQIRNVPQILKIFRTKDVQSLSVLSLVVYIVSQLLWFIYGSFSKDFILLYSSVASIMSTSILLIQYLIYKK